MDYDFAIIFPSRERVSLLRDLIHSIADTTKNIEKVIVACRVDNDDQPTIDACQQLAEKFPFFTCAARNRSTWLNRDYINWAYFDLEHFHNIKYYIVCNDDCLFVTPQWNEIALNTLEDYLKDKKDRIVYGYINDALLNRHGLGYSCFPLISKRAAEVLQYAMPPQYHSWSADVSLWRLFSHHSINRICSLNFEIRHISHHSSLRERDSVNQHVQNLACAGNGWDFSGDLEKLRQAILSS